MSNVNVRDLAKQLGIQEIDLRISLDEAGIPNAQKIQSLSQQQAEIVANTIKAVKDGQPNPYALAPSEQPSKLAKSAQAKPSSSLDKHQQEAHKLATAVYEVAQELGLKDALVSGVQQGEQEILAFEFGRSEVLTQHALRQIDEAQQSLSQRSQFDPVTKLQQMGLALPNESAAQLREKSAAIIEQSNELLRSYGFNLQ